MKRCSSACLLFCCLLLALQSRGQRVLYEYSSTADGKQKLAQRKLAFTTGPVTEKNVIAIDAGQQYQTILGFGGTYSEATSYNLKRIKPEVRREVLRAFFDPAKGAGWTMLRTTINSCDASSAYYSYCETPDDTLLKTFSIQTDLDNYMIPGLQQIIKLQPAVKIFASPWTPPVWMKDSKVFNKGMLLKQYYPAWALYFSKYIAAYKKQGINIWTVTPQNEPAAWEQKWDACGWGPNMMHDFVSNYLGPQLKKDFPAMKLMAFDHNKNFMMRWLDTLLGQPDSRKYFGTVAHHWYEEGEAKNFGPLQEAQQKYPGFPLIASEQGVFGVNLLQPGPGELYAQDIIGNMNNGTAAWVVWGMAFDHNGGPNHAGNFNHSPIMIDVPQNKVYYNPSYYYIAHFSRFVRPGAKRIGFTNNNQNIACTAFQNSNGKRVVVLLNTTDAAENCLLRDGNMKLAATLAPHSIKTFVY